MQLRIGLTTALAACAVLVAPGVAGADVTSQWNAIAQAESILLRPTAHGQARGIAMVEGAVYDAVNAIDRGYEPYLINFRAVGAQPWASQDAAAATAAYRVLLAITPATRHAALTDAYTTTLNGIPDGPIEQGGVAAGEAAAAAMLAYRQNDGFLAVFNPVIGTEAGDWRPIGWPTAPAFDPDGWVGNSKTFVIAEPIRTKGPNALTSRAYARDFAEVKELGALNSATRTLDQTRAAVFWQFAPAILWNTLARDLAARYGLDAADQARLYAMTNLAAADAAISCWYDKYQWAFWRPRAAIREAGTDGNPRTIPDPNWESLFAPATATVPPLGTPPFPDHPSGHGCLSGAVLETMANFFGTDKVAFAVVGGRSLDGVPIAPRQFKRFSDATEEIVEARIWGGIHFRFADTEGAELGEKVAREIKKQFRPLRGHAREDDDEGDDDD